MNPVLESTVLSMTEQTEIMNLSCVSFFQERGLGFLKKKILGGFFIFFKKKVFKNFIFFI